MGEEKRRIKAACSSVSEIQSSDDVTEPIAAALSPYRSELTEEEKIVRNSLRGASKNQFDRDRFTEDVILIEESAQFKLLNRKTGARLAELTQLEADCYHSNAHIRQVGFFFPSLRRNQPAFVAGVRERLRKMPAKFHSSWKIPQNHAI